MTNISWAEYLMKEIYEEQGYDVILDGKPDLILLKDGEIYFAEVKVGNHRKLRKNQQRTIDLLKKHGFSAWRDYVVREKARNIPEGFKKATVFRPRPQEHEVIIYPAYLDPSNE